MNARLAITAFIAASGLVLGGCSDDTVGGDTGNVSKDKDVDIQLILDGQPDQPGCSALFSES